MRALQFVPVVLVAIGVLFLSAAFGDHLRAEDKLTPARKTWLRITWTFCAIAIALSAWQALFAE